MTMQTQTLELPRPNFPMVLRFVSKPIFTDTGEGVTWILGKPNPITPGAVIMRMFFVRGLGVEIYSSPQIGEEGGCMRDTILQDRVLMVNEVMPPEVFVEEITLAEAADDEDDVEEEEPEFEPGDSIATPAPANEPASAAAVATTPNGAS